MPPESGGVCVCGRGGGWFGVSLEGEAGPESRLLGSLLWAGIYLVLVLESPFVPPLAWPRDSPKSWPMGAATPLLGRAVLRMRKQGPVLTDT